MINAPIHWKILAFGCLVGTIVFIVINNTGPDWAALSAGWITTMMTWLWFDLRYYAAQIVALLLSVIEYLDIDDQ